jgi:N-acetylglutamate synthase-like GNAT family acetyltransferase
MINIRPIVEKDIPSVVALILQNLDEVMPKYHSLKVLAKTKLKMTPDQFRAQIKWKQIFVIESEGEIIATGALANFGTSETPKHCVSNVFVKVDRQNQGVGKFLMEHLFYSARTNQIEILHVPSSLNAVPFYQHLGFIRNEAQPDLADEVTWMTKVL